MEKPRFAGLLSACLLSTLVLLSLILVVPVSTAVYTFDCSPTYGCIDYGTKYLNETVLLPGPAELDKYCQETLGSGWLASDQNKSVSMWGTGYTGSIQINVTTGTNPVLVNLLTKKTSWNMASGTYYLDGLCASGERASATTHSYNYYGTFNFVNTSAPVPVCGFTALPTSGNSPLLVTFNDTSTNNPTAWSWQVIDNSTGYVSIFSTSREWINYINGESKTWDINFSASNSYGSCNLYEPNYLTTLNNTFFTFLDVRDITTGSLISNANVGIYEGYNNTWYNTTATTGQATFSGTGSGMITPLFLNENVMLAASATGYTDQYGNTDVGYASIKLTTNYIVTTIWLQPGGIAPAAGMANLYVSVTKNSDGKPLSGESVQLSDANSRSAITDNYGSAYFYNLTPGNQKVTVGYTSGTSGEWYQQQSQYITLASDNTYFMNFSMVAIGQTPVATTVPVTAGTTSTTTTSAGGGGSLITGVPTTVAGQYQGFWAPFYQVLHSMGASDLEMPILMTAFLGFVGMILGALVTNSSPAGALIGGAVGVLVASAIWISLVVTVVLVVVVIFIWIFFIR